MRDAEKILAKVGVGDNEHILAGPGVGGSEQVLAEAVGSSELVLDDEILHSILQPPHIVVVCL